MDAVKNLGYGIVQLTVLRDRGNGLLEHGQIEIEIRDKGVGYNTATGELAEATYAKGSILGWGEFDQLDAHWTLCGHVVTRRQLDDLSAAGYNQAGTNLRAAAESLAATCFTSGCSGGESIPTFPRSSG